MKKLDRLILRELINPFLNSVFMFLMLLFTSVNLLKLTNLLVEGASMGQVALIAIYSLPPLLSQCLPMGLLLGCLLAFGRLSGDSEHVALFSSGISFYRVIVPVTLFGLLVGVLTIAWNEYVVPPSVRQFTALSQKAVVGVKKSDQPIRLTIKRKGADEIDQTVNIEGGLDVRTREAKKITILQYNDDKKLRGVPAILLYAERAVFQDASVANATFYNGFIKYFDTDPKSRVVIDYRFEESGPKDVKLAKDFFDLLKVEFIDNRSMSFGELKAKIVKDRAEGKTETTLGDEVDLWGKLSLPLASIIFGAVAAPLGIRGSRGNRTMGFGVAILLIFFYWITYNWMYQVGRGGSIPPILASFTANIIGVIAAFILVRRTRQ